MHRPLGLLRLWIGQLFCDVGSACSLIGEPCAGRLALIGKEVSRGGTARIVERAQGGIGGRWGGGKQEGMAG